MRELFVALRFGPLNQPVQRVIDRHGGEVPADPYGVLQAGRERQNLTGDLTEILHPRY